MAHFEYFATLDDSRSALRDVLAGGAHVYFTEYFAAPEATPFTSLTPKLESRVQQGGQFFVGGGFSTHPPIFYQLSGGPHAGQYYLREVGGGPFLTWALARERVNGAQEDPPVMLAGELSIPSK